MKSYSTKKSILLFPLTVLLLFFTCPSNGQVIFSDGAEAATKFGGGQSAWSGFSGSGTYARVTDKARSGSYSYKFEVSKGIEGDCASPSWQAMKGELNYNFSGSNNPKFYWMAASTLIPASVASDGIRTCQIAFNIKWDPNVDPTTFWLMYSGERYYFNYVDWSSGKNTEVDLGPVVRDKWEDWVVNFDLTTASTGFLKVYKNGTLVLNKVGYKSKPDGVSFVNPYFNVGVYNVGWGGCWGDGGSKRSSAIVYLDEIKWGGASSTLADFTVGGGSSVAPPANQAPTANAGTNQTITLPTNSVTLTGNGSDPDGSIASWNWTKVSGPAGGTIASPNARSTQISGLAAGTYVYRLTVTDNDGATDTDDISIIVNGAANQTPTANAGANQTITLPTNSVTLTGNGSDPDGNIASWNWTKVSGPAGGTIANPNARSTQISGLTAGTYVYRLTVTDNDGSTATDNVTIVVNAAPAANQLPGVSAGTNQTITLPVSTATLQGTATDADGTIVSYSWIKVSGPAGGSIQSPASVSTQVSGLTAGTYVFRLTVTDNDGGKSSDDVQVTVNSAPVTASNLAPTVDAGTDKTVTLPVNSTTLAGSGTDPDGTVTSYQWTKVAGPAAGAVQIATAASTPVDGLVAGEYTFRLTCTDNKGAKSADDVRVIVNAAAPPPNSLPVANAGSDKSLTLPANSIVLDGSSSSDPDGDIVSWAWAKVKGPGGDELLNANTSKPTLNNLQQGTYEYELTVKDDKGAAAKDRVSITVIRINKKAVAVVTESVSVTLPVQNTELDASASYDPDGTIQSYKWELVKGPSVPKILSPASSRTVVADLIAGTYSFNVTLTDNDGAVTRAAVTVNVKNNSSRRIIPVVNLYPNPAEAQVTLAFDSEIDGRSNLTVYDVKGRPVLSETFIKNSRTYKKVINVSQLPKGVYAVYVEVDQAEPIVKKLVKQ